MPLDRSTLPRRSRAPVPRPARRSLRPLLIRLHFYAAVFVAPFILVAASSGMLYAASPQVEKLIYHDELYNDSTGTALPLSDQIETARAVEPDLPLLAVRSGPDIGTNTQILFDDGRTDDSKRLAVFVDPVTGDVAGSLTSYGSSGSLPFRTWIDELHRGLHLGDPGRIYSELAASWLWVIALAGLALWWTNPGRTRLLRPQPKRPDGTGSTDARRRTLSWHGPLGTWVVLGMLGLSATGLTWSQYAGANVTELRQAMNWSTPEVMADLEQTRGGGDSQTHHGGDSDHSPRTVDGAGYDLALAAASEKGLSEPVEVTGPISENGAFVVQELDPRWPTNADAVSVHPRTGEVLDVVRFEDYPFAAKLATWGIDLHMGLLFGVWNQAALIALGASLLTMVLLGYRMWWLRRPTRGHALRLGRPPRRGSWRSAPRATAALLVLAAVVGWFLPLFGISLLLFVLVDVIVGLYGARRRAGPSA